MTQRIINRYSELSIDEINEPINLKTKSRKEASLNREPQTTYNSYF